MSYALIPRPAHIAAHDGHFTLSRSTVLDAVSPLATEATDWFQSIFHQISGLKLIIGVSSNAICLSEDSELAPESYALHIAPDGIAIRAADSSGFLYGLVSLLQLVPIDAATAPGQWNLPALHVEDGPRFGWRGLMLDSARYFQPVAWIKKFIDLLVLHKFNTFHWHLTDDQGWRIESERYPELTTVSAWRCETRVGHERGAVESERDGKPHGGFYTKMQMREIVAYAQARGITVIPEIEMPGHAQEVLAAFPNLGCSGGPYEVSRSWSIRHEVFCAGNDEVFRFLENVLEEILEIFPSEFIHIGGDECPKMRWKECPKCQARIRHEDLQDEHELQAWFVRHFDEFLRARGRRLIGWDEILEGGLAPNAAVMSWRGEAGGIAAAKSGHAVVMMPQQKVYFDYYQSSNRALEPLAIDHELPLQAVYCYEPIPAELTEEEASRILGGQGGIWTEYMPRPDNIEFMAYPRACALAERLWSSGETRDYADFIARLVPHLRLLDRLNVNYRTPRPRDLGSSRNAA